MRKTVGVERRRMLPEKVQKAMRVVQWGGQVMTEDISSEIRNVEGYSIRLTLQEDTKTTLNVPLYLAFVTVPLTASILTSLYFWSDNIPLPVLLAGGAMFSFTIPLFLLGRNEPIFIYHVYTEIGNPGRYMDLRVEKTADEQHNQQEVCKAANMIEERIRKICEKERDERAEIDALAAGCRK